MMTSRTKVCARGLHLSVIIGGLLQGAAGGCGDDVTSSAVDIQSVARPLKRDSPYCLGGCLQAKDGMKPGAAVFNGKAYFTFVRTDAKIGIVIENDLADDGRQSATTYALNDVSADGASLIVYQNVLHMVYLGTNHQYYMRRSTDGLSWDGPWMLTNSGTDTTYSFLPGLNVWIDGGLRMFYPICVDSNCLFFGPGNLFQADVSSAYPNPPFIQSEVSLSEWTNLPVSATTWHNQLYISWTGTPSSRPIYIKHYDPSTGWSAPTVVQANFGLPSLYPFSPTTLRIIYRGNNSHVYHVDTTDGVSFAAPASFGEVTNVTLAPFALSPANRVWTYYIGTNRDLYTMDF